MTWTTVLPSRSPNGHSVYTKYYDQPIIAINNRFDLLLSPASFEMLGKPTQVEVLHDAGAHLMGIRVAGRDDPGFAVQVGYSTDKSGKRVPITRGMFRISSKAPRDYQWAAAEHITIFRASMDKNGILIADYRYPVETLLAPVRHHK